MCLAKDHILILCLLFFHTEALTCRSDGGPKDSELKSIYNKCLKMQDGKNNSNSRDQDQDWNKGHSQWEPHMGRENDRGRSREERSGSRSDRRSNTDGRMGSYDDSNSNYGSGSNDRSYNDQMSNDRMGYGSGSSNMGRYGNNDDDSMGHNSGYAGGNYNRRNDYQNNDYGSGLSNQYGYQSSTQSSRRYKREHRTENSGQRSQFNPNSKRSKEHSYQSDDKSSKENDTINDDKKACALQCFLENLEMTAEDGIPDRYLVTHVLTKDVTNEDLKDFLQESIEECFHILDSENTEEKCEFSKTLLMCLSEKGRANCDDWKDELRF